MDETTKSLIEKIAVAPAGSAGAVQYDCTRLSPNDLARMAAEATGDLAEGTFDLVVGLAYRGILFAAAVAGGHEAAILQHDGVLCGPPCAGRRVVIVDDVIVTPERMQQARQTILAAGGTVVGFACIVDRSDASGAWTDLPVWSAVQARGS